MTGLQRIKNALREWRKRLNELAGDTSEEALKEAHFPTFSNRYALWGFLLLFVFCLYLVPYLIDRNQISSQGIDWAVVVLAWLIFPALILGKELAEVWLRRYGCSRDESTFIGLLFAIAIIGFLSVQLTLVWLDPSYSPYFDGTELKYGNLHKFLPWPSMTVFLSAGYQTFKRGIRWIRQLDEEKLKREAAEHGQALAEAQLKLLQAQIEPHFLFNTLASVQHLVRKDPPRADFLLSQLIRYLREAMPNIRGMGSTLGREFGLAEAYLNIVQIRLDGRLEIKVTIPPELADISFPALIVQTLVENAIKHGIEPKSGPVHIDVTAGELTVEEKQFIDVCVSDDGVGFGVAETIGTGVGLRNIRERLAGLYGSSACLSIAEVQPSGVCASVRIPKANSVHGAVEQSSAAESGTHGFETARKETMRLSK